MGTNVCALIGGLGEGLSVAQRILPVVCARLQLVEDLLEAGVGIW